MSSRRNAQKTKETVAFYLMAGPQLIGTLIFSFVPVIWSLYLSTTSGQDYMHLSFAGATNYLKMFRDENLGYEIFNTFYYAVSVVILSVGIGLLLANALNQNIMFRSFFRVIYFLPSVTMAAAVGMVWRTMFNPSYGMINVILGFFGIQGPLWLTDPRFMMLAVIIVGVWSSSGHNMIILLSGLNNIPRIYYEAAEIDGATNWHKFVHVTVPLLSPVVFFVTITSTMSALKAFDIIYTLADAGNNVDQYMRYYRTMVYGIYEKGFVQYNLGEASAEAVLLLIFIMMITLFQFRMQKKWVHYE